MIVLETGVIIFFWKTIRALIRETMEFLPDKQLKKLSEHKYKRDGDSTLLEPYLNPFWNWTVEKVPLWVAPNTITFVGLIVNVVTSLIILFYNPDGTRSVPGWAYILAALGVFIYQTLDSIDGKQARRTNSSSPLGELFDHGCDAVSTVVLVVAATSFLHLPPSLHMFLVLGGYFSFYLAHWCTYCTGALRFGKLDVIEVQFLMMGTFTLTAILGEKFWKSQVPVLGLQFNMIVFILILLCGAVNNLTSFHVIFVKGGVGRHGSTVAGTSVLFPIMPICTVLMLTVMIAKKSESLFEENPNLYFCTFGIMFAKITCKLIVAHMCKSELDFWDSIYIGAALLFMNQYFDFYFTEYHVLVVSCVYSTLNIMHYAHAVSSQICEYLRIYCFSLSPRVDKSKAATASVTAHSVTTATNGEALHTESAQRQSLLSKRKVK